MMRRWAVTALGEQFLLRRENRTLVYAVIGSLVVHVALMVLLPVLREAKQNLEYPRQPIVARLFEPQRQPVAILPIAPEAKDAPVEPRRRPVGAKTPPKPDTELTTVQALVRQAAQPAAQASSDAASAESAPSRSFSDRVQSSPRVSDAPDAGTLAQFRLALMSATKPYKRYPSGALENNWQGKVEIRMAIAADGSIANLEVRSSAGYAALDEHALHVVEQAKAGAHIPPALQGKRFTLEIPVVFSLQPPES